LGVKEEYRLLAGSESNPAAQRYALAIWQCCFWEQVARVFTRVLQAVRGDWYY